MWSDLEEEAGEIGLESRLAALMPMALARLWREAEESPAGPCKQKMILDGARQLSQLRGDGLEAERVPDADWKPPQEVGVCPETKALSQVLAESEQIMAGPRRGLLAPPVPGEPRDLSGASINPAESRPIKPNQTKSNLRGVDFCALSRLCPWPCGNQGESNRIEPNQTSCGAGGGSG